MAPSSIEARLGVTRVARVTGLDRAGVEVACAVRPGGHVLQVTNGKGLGWAQARAAAVSEAAELWAAERVDPAQLVWGRRAELKEALEAGPLVAPRLREARIAWRRGRDLLRDREVLVPACAVHCPPFGAPSLGPAAGRWTSNGLGAHPKAEAALRHAVLEAIERDQLARALPGGWTPQAIRERKLRPPRELQPLVDRLRAVRLHPHLFDLRADVELPVAGAILVDEEQGPIPVTAGYACAEDPVEALQGALLEAAQSRLTDVHGAREDVAPVDRGDAAELAAACATAPASVPSFGPVRRRGRTPLAALAQAGHRHLAVVELARSPLHVVKVVSPTLLVSELL